MREEVRNPGRLEHMMLAISRVEEFTEGVSYEQFLKDKMCAHATIYNIQIIGEAAYMLTKDFKANHPELPWSLMEKMRHVIVHDYYNIVPEAIWDVVTEDLPSIKPQIQHLLDEYTKQAEIR